MISKQKEIFKKLADERIKKTELDKKVNSDDTIYRYKGPTPDAKFDEYDNAFDLLDKIREGRKKLSDVKKNDQLKFKSHLGEMKRNNKKKDQKSKKTICIILKCFTKQ